MLLTTVNNSFWQLFAFCLGTDFIGLYAHWNVKKGILKLWEAVEVDLLDIKPEWTLDKTQNISKLSNFPVNNS